MEVIVIDNIINGIASIPDVINQLVNVFLVSDDSLSLYRVHHIINDVVYVENVTTGVVKELKDKEISAMIINGDINITKTIPLK